MAKNNKKDVDQDQLAEEWAAALAEQEDEEPEDQSSASGNEDAMADEWARALAEEEQSKVKKQKKQESLASQTQDAQFKDLTGHSKSAHPEGTKRELDFILDIPLNVSAELGRTQLLINELLQLGQGSVIELNKLAGEPLEVHVNGKLVARGEAVVINEKFGVRLTDIISPIERVKQLA